MDMTILSTALASVKTAAEIVKTVINGKKKVNLDEKIRELSAIISSLYKDLIEARTEYHKCLDVISDVKKQLVEYEDWDKKKSHFKRVNIHGVWVFGPKDIDNPMQEKYWLCHNCITNKKLESVFQLQISSQTKDIFICPNCPDVKITISKKHFEPPSNRPEGLAGR